MTARRVPVDEAIDAALQEVEEGKISPLVLPDDDNVVSALARVIADLPGIGKDSKMQGPGGGYSYRGIETITGHAAGLFAKHGIVVTPRVLSVDYEQFSKTSSGNAIMEARLMVEYTFTHSSMTSITAVTWGVGRDSSDKAGNKAMTAAFKYALLQVLMVADKADDPDSERIEAPTSRQTVSPPPRTPSPPEPELELTEEQERHKALMARAYTLRAVDPKYAEALRSTAASKGYESANAWIAAEPDNADDEIAKLEVLAETEAEAVREGGG